MGPASGRPPDHQAAHHPVARAPGFLVRFNLGPVYPPAMYCRARTLVVLIPCLASGVLFAQPGGDAPEAAAVLDEERSLLGVLTDPDHSRLSSVTLFWDNDGTYPNLIEDTDRFYTSGQGFEVGLSFTPPDPARFAPGWEDPRFGMGFSLKQHIYTASDIEIADPDPDDHPYAGWLSFGFSFQRSDAHRHDHFGGGGRCRRAAVGDEIDQGEIGFVADGRDQRDFAGGGEPPGRNRKQGQQRQETLAQRLRRDAVADLGLGRRRLGHERGRGRLDGGRTALATEERAGDLAGGVLALLDVDRQREEVEVVLGVLAVGGGRQQHRLLVEVGDGGAGGLAGQAARLEADGAGAELAVVDNGFGGDDFGSLHGCPPSGWPPGFGGLRSRPTDRWPLPSFREPLPRTGTESGAGWCGYEVVYYRRCRRTGPWWVRAGTSVSDAVRGERSGFGSARCRRPGCA